MFCLASQTLLNPIIGKNLEDKLLHNIWNVSELLESRWRILSGKTIFGTPTNSSCLCGTRSSRICSLPLCTVVCMNDLPRSHMRRYPESVPAMQDSQRQPVPLGLGRQPTPRRHATRKLCVLPASKRRPSTVSSRKRGIDASKISRGTSPTFTKLNGPSLPKFTRDQNFLVLLWD